MSYRSTQHPPRTIWASIYASSMDSAPVRNYAPPLAWLDRHSAEGGVRCDELKRRDDESAWDSEQDRAEELRAAFREIAREQL